MKIYEKPILKVVLLQHKNMLLTASNEVQSLSSGADFRYVGSDENYYDEENEGEVR